VKEVSPLEMLELALIENIQRADLNPIEEALAYQALIQEFGLTQESVAKQVGKDRSTISNSLRLLQLTPKVREALVNLPEVFTEGHARALININSEEDQIKAMNQIIALNLNVRETEKLAARLKAQEDIDSAIQQVTVVPKSTSEHATLEADFRNALMVKVDLKLNTRGKGTLVLHFNGQEELEGLYSRLVKREE
jgi:ParB family chromosome partitioning protein